MIRYALCAVPVPLKRDFIYSFDDEEMRVIPGVRVKVPFGGRKLTAYVVEIMDERPSDANFEIKQIERLIDKEPVFGDAERRLALWMEYFYFSSRGEVLDAMVPGGKRDVSLASLAGDNPVQNAVIELTDEQVHAINTINSAKSGMFYLYGVTGSGKTEVFLSSAEHVIAEGGQVIYLVPEITLTHQLAQQVLTRFKDSVAILHSALTASQRMTQWKKIQKGEISLIIGARSAVFAPCKNLKMIIIDEEHETSYKSGNNPRYHARQVAQWRARDSKAVLVMGSATPSLEAWRLMREEKSVVRLDLTKRVGGGKMPRVTVADMTGEKGIIGSVLYKKMQETLSRGHQVILFLNRRGYSYFFHCKSCGYTLKCPNCDVSMTYHKKKGVMVCHYCGHTQPPIKVCPECGSLDVMYSGFGTERLQTETETLFREYRVARLDTDIVSSDRKNIRLILDSFRRGQTQILLGTQMIAKGLNFPGVRLVGIVAADSSLLMPDFRADERTFSLLVQVSGRSGRASEDGEVVIQTGMPGNTAIEKACSFDINSFFDNELNIRRDTGFPPFSRMVNILFRSSDLKAVQADSHSFAEALRGYAKDFEVYGEDECAIEKINKNWRYHVLARGKNISAIISAIWKVIGEVKPSRGVIREVDVDPVEMM